MYIINLVILAGSLVLIRNAPGSPLSDTVHKITFIFLLLINPSLVLGAARDIISILWTMHISCYLFYCLLFGRGSKRDWLICLLPLLSVLFHLVWHKLGNYVISDPFFRLLFGFLMSGYYGVLYLLYSFFLGDPNFSLSVYLDNKEISQFLDGYDLSRREMDVCIWIINGLRARQIADKLFISPGTVKNHTKSIYRKMNINGRMDLMHLVWDFSLIRRIE